MADFLASFSFGEGNLAQPQATPCMSIEELQLRFGDLLLSKTTPDRAEHLSTIFELNETMQFSLNLSSAENRVLEDLSILDPSLGGIHSTSVATHASGEQTTREIRASETIFNQPQENPVLQSAVARLVTSALSQVDGSAWMMRDMVRGSEGWSFTYLCKHSSQQWARETKGLKKAIVGEYTLREADPTLMSRPAYDCRGTIYVLFSRSSRSVSIKYDHTPLHRTVAEIAEYFKPPPRTVPRRLSAKSKTPKKPGLARKKRGSTKVLDEDGNPTKRKKSNKSLAPPDTSDPIAEQQLPRDNDQDVQSSVPTAIGTASDATQAEQAPRQPLGGATISLNLSPEETVRRTEVAARLLSESGVDPDSLSTEQFTIFANQSPELQKESLSMLIKYGAERLRIVHPSNKDSSNLTPPNATSTSATQISPSTPSTLRESEGLASELAATLAKRRKPNKLYDAQDSPKPQNAHGHTKPRKVREFTRSRSWCLHCKGRGVKCSREKPTCAQCRAAGLTCEYPLPKKFKSSAPEYSINADQSQIEHASQPLPTEEAAEKLAGEGTTEREPRKGQNKRRSEYEAEEDEKFDYPKTQQGKENRNCGEPEEDDYGKQSHQPSAEEQGADGADASYSSYPQVPVSIKLISNDDMQGQEPQSSQLPSHLRSSSDHAPGQPEEPSEDQSTRRMSVAVALSRETCSSHSLMATVTDNEHAEALVHLLTSPSEHALQRSKNSRHSLPTAPSQKASSIYASTLSDGVDTSTHNTVHTLEMPSTPPASDRNILDSPQMQKAVALSQATLEHQRHTQRTSWHSDDSSTQPTQDQSQTQGQLSPKTADRRAQAAAASVYLPPSTAEQPMSSSSQYPTATPTLNGEGNFADALSNSSSDRICYEPYSYQRSRQSSGTYPSYDCGRGPASVMAMDGSAMETRPHASSHNSLGPPLSMPDSRSRRPSSRATSPFDPSGGDRRRLSQVSSVSPRVLNLRTASPSPPERSCHESINGSPPRQEAQQQARRRQQESHNRQQQHQHPNQPQNPQHSPRHQHQQRQQQYSPKAPSWYNISNSGSSNHQHHQHHHSPSDPLQIQRQGYDWNMADDPWGGTP